MTQIEQFQFTFWISKDIYLHTFSAITIMTILGFNVIFRLPRYNLPPMASHFNFKIAYGALW